MWWLSALVAIGALTYANTLANPFVLDDRGTILENAQIRTLASAEVLSPEPEQTVAGRPVVNVSFALNYAVGGVDPTGYHVVNISLHLVCGLLLFGIARMLWPRAEVSSAIPANRFAFAVALLWLVHPLNSEVVNYTTQRTESMMAAFYLATLHASLCAASGSALWIVGATAACALGMASKESMVTAPLMVVLIDRLFLFNSVERAFRSRWRLYLALASTWIVLGALLAGGPRSLSAGFSSGMSPWTYLLNQAPMIVRYLRLVMWPASLVANYGWPRPFTLGDVLPSALGVVALLASTIIALRRSPPLGFLGVWFFVTLAPTSSIVPIATEVGAERRMYLPSMAVIAAIVAGTIWVWRQAQMPVTGGRLENRRAIPVALIVLLCASSALAMTTVARNREYRSDLELARVTLERYPTPVAHHSLAVRLLEAGRRDEGLAHLRRALPGDPRAHYTIGVELFRDGRLDDALAHLGQFIDEQPKLRNVVAARGFRGEILATQGNWPAAIDEYRAVLAIEPGNAAATLSLADALVAVKALDEAIECYRRYLMIDPDDPGALNQFGLALGMAGHNAEALEALRRATTLDPHHPQAQYNLALALWMQGDAEGAIPHARQAVALQPDDPSARALLQGLLDPPVTR